MSEARLTEEDLLEFIRVLFSVMGFNPVDDGKLTLEDVRSVLKFSEQDPPNSTQ